MTGNGGEFWSWQLGTGTSSYCVTIYTGYLKLWMSELSMAVLALSAGAEHPLMVVLHRCNSAGLTRTSCFDLGMFYFSYMHYLQNKTCTYIDFQSNPVGLLHCQDLRHGCVVRVMAVAKCDTIYLGASQDSAIIFTLFSSA